MSKQFATANSRYIEYHRFQYPQILHIKLGAVSLWIVRAFAGIGQPGLGRPNIKSQALQVWHSCSIKLIIKTCCVFALFLNRHDYKHKTK